MRLNLLRYFVDPEGKNSSNIIIYILYLDIFLYLSKQYKNISDHKFRKRRTIYNRSADILCDQINAK